MLTADLFFDLSVIYVITDYRSYFSSAFDVGGGDYNAFKRHKLGYRHLFYIAAENNAVIRRNYKLTVTDVESAVFAKIVCKLLTRRKCNAIIQTI